jgi:hypothetical protein
MSRRQLYQYLNQGQQFRSAGQTDLKIMVLCINDTIKYTAALARTPSPSE